jgi:hypothetical protein
MLYACRYATSSPYYSHRIIASCLNLERPCTSLTASEDNPAATISVRPKARCCLPPMPSSRPPPPLLFQKQQPLLRLPSLVSPLNSLIADLKAIHSLSAANLPAPHLTFPQPYKRGNTMTGLGVVQSTLYPVYFKKKKPLKLHRSKCLRWTSTRRRLQLRTSRWG